MDVLESKRLKAVPAIARSPKVVLMNNGVSRYVLVDRVVSKYSDAAPTPPDGFLPGLHIVHQSHTRHCEALVEWHSG
ncbi:hypothetical protein T265_08523 [Opisthorchis viverrini]|uniref:Uncharacterized protein n=1 Tax=Opisthorchis viverrini TaxID=6198 RepID=A0A074ZD89_OPIVI|nr:hypothetical protein T265_08523 [Opisthorchis viverrini]KER23622.1 hypothetical protein T265_08523 [Opisthorchis viverrini]